MKVLVFGFPRYADHENNPSEKILPLIDGGEIVTKLLPLSWEEVKEAVNSAIDETKPDAVIVANICPFRHQPTAEQYAYNGMNSAGMPDKDGIYKENETIVEGGAASITTSIDIETLANYLHNQGYSGYRSVDPGHYIDNEAYYLALSKIKQSLLLHLPTTDYYSIEDDAEVVKVIIDYLNY